MCPSCDRGDEGDGPDYFHRPEADVPEIPRPTPLSGRRAKLDRRSWRLICSVESDVVAIIDGACADRIHPPDPVLYR